MFTPSDFQTQRASGGIMPILAGILFFLLPGISGFTQPFPVTITIAVAPPYTSHVNDYISQPNKIMATLINTSVSARSVYIQGAINGQGLRVYTDPGFKMPESLTLQPGIPYLMNLDNIQQVFDADHLKYEGITKNEILYGNGLPEGDYQICLRAFDYGSGVPLSPEEPQGCSNVFSVSDIEPPIILQPICGTEIKPATPQLVTFTWTYPPGAPITTQYSLKIIEVLPTDRNINDAMQSSVHPIFFEKTFQMTTCILGPADPGLVDGKRYAFSVTAIDPSGKTTFRNKGMSEVCSFDYKTTEISPKSNTTIIPVTGGSILPIFQQQFELAPRTIISGKLLAKFPTSPTGPLSVENQVNVIPKPGNIIFPGGSGTTFNYSNLIGAGLLVKGNVNFNNFGLGPPLTQNNGAPWYLNQYGGPMLTQMNSKKFIFASLENTNYTKPLPNTMVKLVVRFAVLNTGTFGIDIPTRYGGLIPMMEGLDLQGKYHTDAGKYADVILDVQYTDADGNYTFDFFSHFFTGPVVGHGIDQNPKYGIPINPFEQLQNVIPGAGQVYINPQQLQNVNTNNLGIPSGTGQGQQKVMSGNVNLESAGGYFCLKVEVDNEKFCSPDIDIFAMPGDVLNLPVQVAKLKTYDLTLEVLSTGRKNQLNGASKPLAGVGVEILRDSNQLHYEIPLILDYEGQRLGTTKTNNNGTFREVCTGKTKIDGIVVFKNLVRHAVLNPQYLFGLEVRDTIKAVTDYDYTLYNYKSRFEGLPTNKETDANMTPSPFVVYNHQYPTPTQVKMTFKMEPLPPEIKGRVMASSNMQNMPVEGAWVQLLNQTTNSKISDYTAFIYACYGNKEPPAKQTNSAGFFRFPKLKVTEKLPDSNMTGPFRRLYIDVPSFKKVIIPPLSELPYLLSYGQLKDIKDINLEPGQMLSGNVEDEAGQSVPAYIKSKYSPWYKTKSKAIMINLGDPSKSIFEEIFEVPTEQGGTILSVNPLSSQYFSRDTSIGNPNPKIKVIVYKKLHRPMLTVKDKQGNPVEGAVVMIAGSIGITNLLGKVSFKFASPENQFVMRIYPPEGFVPLQEPILIPVSANWTNYSYTLQKAKSISGNISDKNNGNPIEGAVIFSELTQTDGISLYIEAKSNAQGYYKLNGIPSNLTKIKLHIGKEGSNPTYLGLVQDVSFSKYVKIGTTPSYNFQLTPISNWDISAIWGFPVVVESFESLPPRPGENDLARIGGYFNKPPAVQGFTPLLGDLKIPFKELEIHKTSEGKAEPTDTKIHTGKLNIPMRLAQAFNADFFDITSLAPGYNIMTGTPNMIKTNLSITRDGFTDDAAGMKGHLLLDPGSFKISNDFSGTMYLGDDTLSGRSVVFANKPIPGIGNKHYLFSLDYSLKPVPVKDYRIFNFKADASVGQSYQEGGQIRLRTTVHTAIPVCATCQLLDVKIDAGDLVISSSGVNFEASQGYKLNFPLEKWNVKSQKNWTFDKPSESFVLPDVIIETLPGLDVKVKNLKIRPTTLSEGVINLTGGMQIGQIATMQLPAGSNTFFNYDPGPGHFRISIIGDATQPAGIVPNLPNTFPSSLEFKSIGLLSNNNNVLTIGKKYRFFDIIEMYVDQVMTGPGFFKLNGQPETGIPKFTGQSAVMSYFKTGNKLSGKMEPIKGYVESSGLVDFFLDEADAGQSVKTGEFKSYGNLKIKPPPGQAGDPVYLRGLLTKTKSTCRIDVIKVDDMNKYSGPNLQKMKVGDNIFNITEGSTIAYYNTIWTYLNFKGNCSSITGLNGPSSNNILNFTVKGAIDITSNDIKATNIDTPLGSMNMVFNFDEPSMTGTLKMTNLNMGFASISNGMMGLRFDGSGYYMAFNGTLSLGATGGYEGGFLLGKTSHIRSEHLNPILNGFSSGYAPNFSQGLTGFYAIGERQLFNESFALVVAIDAKAGIGAYVNANFNSNSEFILGGYGYAKLSGGIDVELCYFGICNSALMDIHGGYSNGSFSLSQCGTASIGISACGVGVYQDFKLHAYYQNGFHMDVSLGSCGGKSNQNACN